MAYRSPLDYAPFKMWYIQYGYTVLVYACVISSCEAFFPEMKQATRELKEAKVRGFLL